MEDSDTFSTNQLDILIELAGTQITYIVQPIADNLTAQLEAGTKLFPEHLQYLLDNCELSRYGLHSVDMFERLFDLLREVLSESPDHYKWIFDLYRTSSKRTLEPNSEAGLGSSPVNTATETGEITLPIEQESSLKMLHDLDCSLEFEDFIDWMGQSPDIRNLMMFVEGLVAWMDANPTLIPEQCTLDVLRKIVGISRRRNWKTIPFKFFDYFRGFNSKFFAFLKRLMNSDDLVTVENHQWHEKFTKCYDDAAGDNSQTNTRKYIVEFNPHGKKCPMPGKCGISLKTVWHKETGLNISLCTETTIGFHCHNEVRPEDIRVQTAAVFLVPTAWYDIPEHSIINCGSVRCFELKVYIQNHLHSPGKLSLFVRFSS